LLLLYMITTTTTTTTTTMSSIIIIIIIIISIIYYYCYYHHHHYRHYCDLRISLTFLPSQGPGASRACGSSGLGWGHARNTFQSAFKTYLPA
jgi:hypothetical protein